MRIEKHLEKIVAEAITSTLQIDAPPLLRPAKDLAHGDYQVNGIMPLAKQLKSKPSDLAQTVSDALAKHDAIAKVEVAGPGFINLFLNIDWIEDCLRAMKCDGEKDGVPKATDPERIVVDFSSPNIAKPMHVGHLRSTIIGDAIVRILRFVGHEVVSDNHLGDWGTQFGLLIAGMRKFGSQDTTSISSVEALVKIYKAANDQAKEDSAFAEQARKELAKLQAGDEENLAIWKNLLSTSLVDLKRVYKRLDVRFDEWLGESFYQDKLATIVTDLVERKIAREDDGAICVFFEDVPELARNKTPFIIRKKDGAFLYATTDIATVLHRRDHHHAGQILYVVDQRQSLHFKQLFATMKKMGVTIPLEHIGFGTVLGNDNKPLKTREGDLISLEELLDEAERRAISRMQTEGLNLSPSEIQALAPVVGIGAIKYADLQQNRTSDYQFDWEKMISFKGNAAPYLQYAHTRIQAIFRKGNIDPDSLIADTPLHLLNKAEIALAKQLIRFPEIVHQAAETRYPHLICDHLYLLARLFSTFYEECPVLRSADKERKTRLALSSMVSRQIKRGLTLLGIDVPDRM